MQMPKHCLSIHRQASCSSTCLSNALTNVTNELTKIFGLLEHQSHVGQRARGVARFRPLGHRNSPPADAARGPITNRQIAFGGQQAGIASAALLELANA